MFALAWLYLPDLPTYRTGLIIVGLARCIAMVLIWNDLSGGHREAAAVLVALNSLFQIVAFCVARYFLSGTSSQWLGLSTQGLHLSVWKIAETVAIFLGIPLLAGYLTRTIANACVVESGTRPDCCPGSAPSLSTDFFYTIVILFALQGHTITSAAERRRSHSPATALLLRHHVVWVVRARVVRSGFPTIEPPPSPSPPLATTSNWRSPCASASLA